MVQTSQFVSEKAEYRSRALHGGMVHVHILSYAAVALRSTSARYVLLRRYGFGNSYYLIA